MPNKYPYGQSVQAQGEFKDPALDNAYYDPDVVKVSIRDPGANVDTFTYGVAGVVRVSTGIYTYDWTPDESGDWFYRWHSETSGGAMEAADEEQIIVKTPQTV